MTLKESLLQLCDIQKEIKELEKKISDLNNHKLVSDSVKGSSRYFPYIERNYIIQGIDIKKQQKIEEYKTILQNRYDKLLETQIEVEKFIDKMPTSRLRRIFGYKYINQFSWVKVADLIGGSATEESIKKEHQRFLEKN